MTSACTLQRPNPIENIDPVPFPRFKPLPKLNVVTFNNRERLGPIRSDFA